MSAARLRQSVATLLRTSWHGDLRYLLSSRALRSVSQGYLSIIVPLYLVRAGYDTVRIGVLLTGAAAGGAGLTALVGFAADRWGRKPMLVVLGLTSTGGAIVFALTTQYAALVIAAAVGAIGLGGGAASGGGFGPYYPAEQALVAEHAGDAQRTTVFAGLSLVGVLAASVGAALAGVPRLVTLAGWGTRLDGFHFLFWLTALVGLATAAVVLPVRETAPAAEPAPPASAAPPTSAALPTSPAPRASRASRASPAPPASPAPLSPRTRGLLLRFAITNAVNGMAIGFLGPILALWFHLRYGVDAATIGSLYLVINLAAVISYVGVPWVTRRFGGVVRTIVAVRLASAALLGVIPLMPTFALAGAAYLVRMLANALSVPVRQSYVMGIVAPEERSRMAALSNLPARVFALAGPTLAGLMMGSWWIGVPLELASGLQLAYAGLYWRFFHHIYPPEEVVSGSGAGERGA